MLARLAKWSDSHESTRLLRRRLAAAPGVSHTLSALDQRRLRRLREAGPMEERSKRGWSAVGPDAGLTWGTELSGVPPFEAADNYGVFGEDRTIVEIGPGYGRLLTTALERDAAFGSYIGLDLSARNVGHLSDRFNDPRVEFVLGDVDSFSFGRPIDAAVSFLTFKHLYPSFAGALQNIGGQLRPGGKIVFDVIEGSRTYFQRDGSTFLHEYTRAEITEIVNKASLELIGFDRIVHAPGRERLLVIAGKPALDRLDADWSDWTPRATVASGASA